MEKYTFEMGGGKKMSLKEKEDYHYHHSFWKPGCMLPWDSLQHLMAPLRDFPAVAPNEGKSWRIRQKKKKNLTNKVDKWIPCIVEGIPEGTLNAWKVILVLVHFVFDGWNLLCVGIHVIQCLKRKTWIRIHYEDTKNIENPLKLRNTDSEIYWCTDNKYLIKPCLFLHLWYNIQERHWKIKHKKATKIKVIREF